MATYTMTQALLLAKTIFTNSATLPEMTQSERSQCTVSAKMCQDIVDALDADHTLEISTRETWFAEIKSRVNALNAVDLAHPNTPSAYFYDGIDLLNECAPCLRDGEATLNIWLSTSA